MSNSSLATIDLSWNALGPSLQPFPDVDPDASALAFLDIRANKFKCPYPDGYPVLTLAFLRSACEFDFVPLLITLAYAVAGAVMAVLLLLALRYWFGAAHMQFPIFIAASLAQLSPVVFDAISYRQIISFLRTSSAGVCHAFNRYCRRSLTIAKASYFLNLNTLSIMSVYFSRYQLFRNYETVILAAPTFAPSTTFASYYASISSPANSIFYTGFSSAQREAQIQTFANLCATAPECGYDAPSRQCTLMYPQLAQSAGSVRTLPCTRLCVYVCVCACVCVCGPCVFVCTLARRLSFINPSTVHRFTGLSHLLHNRNCVRVHTPRGRARACVANRALVLAAAHCVRGCGTRLAVRLLLVFQRSHVRV